ncbi:hypothetical protein RvY_06654 [Ramazzottius varieornatus]|uniref:Uncharacterized protein n=1 Tax=Ramazzottius varieornatus TaxID=947166 RepID=A0A1D1V8W3_RAMVA|nr:hypothetical protein RvY_06654 [Ramazzottius varieornatus]
MDGSGIVSPYNALRRITSIRTSGRHQLVHSLR